MVDVNRFRASDRGGAVADGPGCQEFGRAHLGSEQVAEWSSTPLTRAPTTGFSEIQSESSVCLSDVRLLEVRYG